MPLTLNVGITKKIGLPDYGSLGATCNVVVELDGSLLQNDLDNFHRRVRDVYVACAQAVNDELSRHQQSASTGGAQNQSQPNGNGRHNANDHSTPRRSTGRRVTVSQARALRAIADRQGLDLAAELQNRFGVQQPEDLSISEASQLIDDLKALANGHGVGR